VIQVPRDAITEEKLFDLAAEAGADELDDAEDRWLVLTPVDQFDAVRTFLEGREVPIAESALEMIPKSLIQCDEEATKDNQALIDWLENIDDVDLVYHNMDV